MASIAVPGREVRGVIGAVAEFRAVKDGNKTTLVGYAAKYDVRSEPIYGQFFEVIKRGAFASALEGKDDVRALLDHDASMVLGRTRSKTLRLSDDSVGLKFELDLPDTTVARDLAVSVERGDISQMSFGFRKIRDRWTENVDPTTKLTVTTRELLEVELMDVSPVAFPAYLDTEVSVRSLNAFREERDAGLRNARARLRLASV